MVKVTITDIDSDFDPNDNMCDCCKSGLDDTTVKVVITDDEGEIQNDYTHAECAAAHVKRMYQEDSFGNH